MILTTIAITSVGCPGASTFLKQIKTNCPNVKLVGLDTNPYAIGRYICDEFSVIPFAEESHFIEGIQKIINIYKPNLLWVINSKELLPVAKWVELNGSNIIDGCRVITQSEESIQLAENKYELYQNCTNLSIKVPKYKSFSSLNEFDDAVKYFTSQSIYNVCIKPSKSSGSRGFRVISLSDDDSISKTYIDEFDKFLNEKPAQEVVISIDKARKLFSTRTNFEEMLLMEYVQGICLDVMAFLDHETHQPLLISQKTRETSRSGVIMSGEHVWEEYIPSIISMLSSKLSLSGFNGFQFIGENLIEINPRVSSFIYTKEWSEPSFALKYYLGEFSSEDLIRLQTKYPLGARLIRYFDCYTQQ